MHTARDVRKVCSRIGFAFAAMLIMVLCAQFVLSLLALNFAPWFVYNETGYWLLADGAIYLCGAPVFLLILHTIPDGREGEREKLRMNPLRYLLVLVVCLGTAYAASFVTNFFLIFVEMFKNSPVQMPDVLAESSFPISLFFGAVVPGLGEEFLFRYCLRKKLRGAGDKIFILISALCFAVFHMNLGQLIFTFFVGAIFAWIYTQTGSIWYSVSLHFLFNTVSLVLSQLQEELYGVLIAYVGIMFMFIAISLTTLVLSMRYVRTHLRPPEEAGWPYKPPPAKYMAGQAAHTQGANWYGYAQYGPYNYAMHPQQAPYSAYAPFGQPAYGIPMQSYGTPAQGYPQGQYGMPPQMAQQPVYGYPGAAPAYPGPGPGMMGQLPYVALPPPQQPVQQPMQAQDCPELVHAAYNNMPQNHTPPAYQNMRPVWPKGHPRATQAAAPPYAQGQATYGQYAPGQAAMPPLFGTGQSNSIFKTCFLNPGMLVYLLGGFIVIVLSLML